MNQITNIINGKTVSVITGPLTGGASISVDPDTGEFVFEGIPEDQIKLVEEP